MPVALIVPNTPEVVQHNWANEPSTEQLTHALQHGATAPRVIVPPCVEYSSLGSVADGLTNAGVEVRVRSTQHLFALYGDQTAMLSHRETPSVVTRHQPLVAALHRVFDDHWSLALPWQAHVRGTTEVLDLMALGWTDTRIAQTLGLSMRTLSRRVAEAMTAVNAESRFELGMKYAVLRRTSPRHHLSTQP